MYDIRGCLYRAQEMDARTAIWLLAFNVGRLPQGLTLQWWMCSVAVVWGPTRNPGIPLGPFQLQLEPAPHRHDVLL